MSLLIPVWFALQQFWCSTHSLRHKINYRKRQNSVRCSEKLSGNYTKVNVVITAILSDHTPVFLKTGDTLIQNEAPPKSTNRKTDRDGFTVKLDEPQKLEKELLKQHNN